MNMKVRFDKRRSDSRSVSGTLEVGDEVSSTPNTGILVKALGLRRNDNAEL